MSIHAQPGSFRCPERRRSERLPFRETLFVCGRCEGGAFKEETLTISVLSPLDSVPLAWMIGSRCGTHRGAARTNLPKHPRESNREG